MKLLGWLVAVVACPLVLGSSAEAQTVSVDRCAGAKMRCVMGYTHICGVVGVEGQLKCYQTATLRGRFVDQVCITRTVDKIHECFRAAESRNVCRTAGDANQIQAKIEPFVLDVIRDVTPGFPYPSINTCAAGKQKALADATSAKLGCFEEAFRGDPGLVAPGCLAQAQAQYEYAWLRLALNRGCSTGDEIALTAKMDAFVADMVVTLDP
jgi:hypothetical protein